MSRFPSFVQGPVTDMDDLPHFWDDVGTQTEPLLADRGDADRPVAVVQPLMAEVPEVVVVQAERPLWEHAVNPIWRTVPLLRRRIAWIALAIVVAIILFGYLVIRIFTGVTTDGAGPTAPPPSCPAICLGHECPCPIGPDYCVPCEESG